MRPSSRGKRQLKNIVLLPESKIRRIDCIRVLRLIYNTDLRAAKDICDYVHIEERPTVIEGSATKRRFLYIQKVFEEYKIGRYLVHTNSGCYKDDYWLRHIHNRYLEWKDNNKWNGYNEEQGNY